MMQTRSRLSIPDLGPGDHLCCLYETEEEHRAVLTPFLRQGLERREKVLYIVDAREAETILDYLRHAGLDVGQYLARGQLAILSREDAYTRDGLFDPDGMIALLQTETQRSIDEGYSALRVTGEMTWALRGLPGSERLIEYEAKLNEFFPGSRCLAICQYDRRRFDPVVLLDVLRTHPTAVIGTEVCDNFYYISPADLLRGDPEAATLRNSLEHLVERKRADEALQKRTHQLGERVKELNCLYRISALVDQPDTSLEEIAQGTADLIPPSWQYPEVTCARIILENQEFKTENFRETGWRQASDIRTRGARIGSVEVFYLEERPESDEGPFLKEERSLVDAIAERLGRITEHKRADEALRRQKRELEIRDKIAHIFLTVSDEEMYADVLDVILEALASEYGVFGFIDEKGDLVVPSMSRQVWERCQVPDKDIVFPRETWGDSTWVRAIREKRPIFSNEPSINVPAGHVPVRRHIAYPIIYQGVVVGITEVANKETDYGENDIQLLGTINEAIAPVLATRVQRNRLEKQRERGEEAMRSLNKQLEEASRHKSEFLANLSHELRTPLNAVLGASELLAEGLFGGLSEKQEEYVRDIHECGTHLLSLINDVLDLSKVEAGKLALHLGQFDVGSLMESSAIIVRERAASKSLDFEVIPPPEEIVVEADERKVKQIVYNLLSNAVKFTPEKGRVIFRAHRYGDEAVFSVEDTGPGVAEEFRAHIFEEFFQTPDSQEGTGLGLALSKRLVELHGGRIWLESQVGQGCRFCFAIPIGRQHRRGSGGRRFVQ